MRQRSKLKDTLQRVKNALGYVGQSPSAFDAEQRGKKYVHYTLRKKGKNIKKNNKQTHIDSTILII